MRARGWAVAVGLVAVFLVGCGEGGDPETTAKHSDAPKTAEKRPDRPRKMREVVVTLSGWEGPESVGALMADAQGYFAEEGLRVSILVPASVLNTIGYVVNRTDDLGVSQQPEVVLEKQKGAPIKAVGSVIPRPTATMIWLRESKIRGTADLKGKTIAIPGLPFQRAFLESVLERAGLTLEDVRVKSVGYDLVPSLVSGRVDAIFGGSGDVEGVELESRGLTPVVTPVGSLGLPAYEGFVWISRVDFAAKHPRLIRGFMSAVRRGTAAAIADPKAAAEVIDESVERNPESGLGELEDEVEATLPLLSKTGYMSPGRAARLVDWMRDQGLIQREVPPAALLTNRFVP